MLDIFLNQSSTETKLLQILIQSTLQTHRLYLKRKF
jgi:hypothetical protein